MNPSVTRGALAAAFFLAAATIAAPDARAGYVGYFTGTITSASTNDTGNFFGGGSLVGQRVMASFSIDPSGQFQSACGSPGSCWRDLNGGKVTSSFTINGITVTTSSQAGQVFLGLGDVNHTGENHFHLSVNYYGATNENFYLYLNPAVTSYNSQGSDFNATLNSYRTITAADLLPGSVLQFLTPNGQNLIASIDSVDVPEPATAALFGGAIFAICTARRRRARATV